MIISIITILASISLGVSIGILIGVTIKFKDFEERFRKLENGKRNN